MQKLKKTVGYLSQDTYFPGPFSIGPFVNVGSQSRHLYVSSTKAENELQLSVLLVICTKICSVNCVFGKALTNKMFTR
jgi:ABC-type cobalamin/Fe3+-siderophores transport system ATPase subunit